MNHVTLPLHNLGFQGAHAAHAERALTQLPGVVRAFVCADTEMAYIEYEARDTGPDSIEEALIASGFGSPLAAPVEPPPLADHVAAPPHRPASGAIVLAGALWLLLGGSLLAVTWGVAVWPALLVAGGGALGALLLTRARGNQKAPAADQPTAERGRGAHARDDQ